MGLRPAKCYRKLERPYTRISIRRPRKGYVKGVPESKIHRFQMGKMLPNFTYHAYLVTKQGVQIRHNALEAARVAANKVLTNGAGPEGFFLKILIYPFHVLRENPLATGAGADRFQTGMRQSFGKPIGTAARVKPEQRLIHIAVDPGKSAVAKRALKIASYKLPTTCRVVIVHPGNN